MAVIRIYGSSIVLKKLSLFSLTLMYLNSSLNPLLLEDETRSTRYHTHTAKDVLDQQSAISDQLQSVIECIPY